MASWGVLLDEAQRVAFLLHYPWLIFPAVPVLILVIAYNFLGDALRDAADPYSALWHIPATFHRQQIALGFTRRAAVVGGRGLA
jgi:hypothetical protein